LSSEGPCARFHCKSNWANSSRVQSMVMGPIVPAVSAIYWYSRKSGGRFLLPSGLACHRGMVTGMASKKVTITLDEAQLERIRALVQAGMAPSVSGFVQHAVGVSLDDVAGWGALLAEALQETGGPLSDSERAWADEALGITQRGGRSAA